MEPIKTTLRTFNMGSGRFLTISTDDGSESTFLRLEGERTIRQTIQRLIDGNRKEFGLAQLRLMRLEAALEAAKD